MIILFKIFAIFARLVMRLRGQQPQVVFFDTNCYRQIARKLPNRINITMGKIVLLEAYRGKKAFCSYLVLSEMLSHLTDNPSADAYQECKLGLKAAIRHIAGYKVQLLYSPDGQILQFFFNNDLPPSFQKREEESIVEAVNFLNEMRFSDKIIAANIAQINQAKQHIEDLKESWIQSTIVQVIQKIDPTFQYVTNLACANDDAKRAHELQNFETAEASGTIYDNFALGMCLYIQNNFNVQLNPNRMHIDRIKFRFKSIFHLQLRIIKKFFSHGYNHNNPRKLNDVIDYLICTALSPDTVFVTNEVANLKTFLAQGGITNVMSLAEYLKYLGLNRLAKKLALPNEQI
jgi:hypothetical protein